MKWYIVVFVFVQSLFQNSTVGFRNLARTGTADQSSSYLDYDASKAIDGDKNQIFEGKSCTHTAINQGTAWWRLDIGQSANIYNVVIYYRLDKPDRLSGFSLYIGDLFNPKNQQSSELCYLDKYDGAWPNTIQNITCNSVGRYVVIYNERSTYDAFLELCEVEVYGCYFGRYGNNCEHSCSPHCTAEKTCDVVTGGCICQSGYRGQTCYDVCPTGTYGLNCVATCKNCLSENCSPINGTCLYGCNAGWKSDMCDSACDKGTYGLACNQSCSNCVDETCNQFDGKCINIGVCKPGFMGSKCDEVCNFRLFGNGCKDSCHCVNGTSCNNVHGHCFEGSCERGWSGKSCNKRCTNGTYGYGCTESCAGCIDDMCEVEFGNCSKSGCKPGFKGHKCKILAIAEQFKDRANSSAAAVGGGVGTAAVLLLIIITIFFIYRRRSTKKKMFKFSHSDLSVSEADINYQSDLGCSSKRYDGKEYVNIETTWINGTDHLVSIDNSGFQQEDQKENVYANESKKSENVYSNSEKANLSQYMISIKDLAATVERKKKTKELHAEYAMLPMGSQYYSHNEAAREENKHKNRFLTTFAYDHSRVKLIGNTTTDYINANYIKSYSNDRAYIATQGPKKNTLNDFWQMIWQENVGKIVMATKLKEGEKKKCEQYWPQSTRASLVIGNFALRMTTEKNLTMCTYRGIEVTHKMLEEKRNIHQFHFTQWPDHGVPNKTNLFRFHRKVKSTYTEFTGPLLVHCSAGIGRTGTYIALDALYDNGQRTGHVNVMEFTEMMRKDRMNMIQTVEQYIMVYEVLVEAFSFDDTSIPSKTFSDTIESKQTKIIGDTENFFTVEYKKLIAAKLKTDTDKFQAGKRRENIAKNVVQNILPHDEYRPFLMSYGRSRNDYINAVIIPSFVQGKNFIVTQYPMKDTVGDFWSLVYDHDCRILVLLEGKPLDVSFFPDSIIQESSFDNFIVSTSSTDQSTNRYTIKLRHKNHDDDIRNITVYITDELSENTTKPNKEKTAIDFIGMVSNDGKTNSSVVVLCRDGCTRCSVYVALSLAIQEIEMDEEVDLFQIARRIQTRRPEFLTNAEQYEFVYRCISEYLRNNSVYANT